MGKTVMFSEHEFINIDRELDVYEGVPFAEPPVRFEYPREKDGMEWYLGCDICETFLLSTVQDLSIGMDCKSVKIAFISTFTYPMG